MSVARSCFGDLSQAADIILIHAWMVGSGPTVTEERWRCLGGSAAGSSLLSGLRISPNEKGRALRAALSCLCVLSYSAKKAKRMTKRMATMAVAGWMSFHLPVKSFRTT